MTRRSRDALGYAAAVVLPALVTVVLVPIVSGDQSPNVVFAYLVAVVVAALLGGASAGLLASAISFLLVNFFFIEPVRTLSVTARRDVGVLVGFVFTALVVSSLLDRIERRRRDSESQAADLALLYDVSLAFATGDDADEELANVAALARDRLGFSTVAVVRGRGSALDVLFAGGVDEGIVVRDAAMPAPTPLVVRAPVGTSRGDVLLVGYPGGRPFDERTRRLFAALAGQAAAALRRADQEEARRDLEVLGRTDRQRAALISAMSHDLRTPLAAISVSASALEHALRGSGEPLELAAAISEQAARLDRMVANLLALGRIEGGVLRADREPIPVDELVGCALSAVRPRLGSRSVVVDVGDLLPTVFVDAVQVGQSLTNLIHNVLEHTPESAALRVGARAVDGFVTLSVSDTGRGIPEGYRSVIFDRFGRAPGAGSGSGLGLAIARAYAEASGGTLTLAATGRTGTSFDLTLPVRAS